MKFQKNAHNLYRLFYRQIQRAEKVKHTPANHLLKKPLIHPHEDPYSFPGMFNYILVVSS